MKLDDRCRPIELILSDVDGVLTGGEIVLDNRGIESKQFHIRDGLGVRLWQRAGGRFGIVTSRSSHVVELRAAELSIDLVRQGMSDKLPVVREIMADLGVEPAQVAFIGDDLPDLAVIELVGLGVAVADACPELRDAAPLVTTAPGGQGAVREAIERILKAQNRWDDLMQAYRL